MRASWEDQRRRDERERLAVEQAELKSVLAELLHSTASASSTHIELPSTFGTHAGAELQLWTICFQRLWWPGCCPRHLRLPGSWDDAERQEFIDEAAEQVALRVAELADDWADRAVTEWGREHWRLPDSETQAELVRAARTSALVMVLCDVLPDVPVGELYAAV